MSREDYCEWQYKIDSVKPLVLSEEDFKDLMGVEE